MISQNGKSINHLLRKGLYDIAPFPFPNKKFLKFDDLVELYDPTVDDEPVEFLTKRKYETDEDILLLQLKKDGLSFSQMESMFVNRTAASLSSRFRYIDGKQKKSNNFHFLNI